MQTLEIFFDENLETRDGSLDSGVIAFDPMRRRGARESDANTISGEVRGNARAGSGFETVFQGFRRRELDAIFDASGIGELRHFRLAQPQAQ